jgi:hypothetical protein
LKLLRIRTEIEKSIRRAVPGWKLFSANTIEATDEDYPCINTFFDCDRLVGDEGPLETRRVGFQLEAGFNVISGDPEADLIELRQRIEHAIELNRTVVRITPKSYQIGLKPLVISSYASTDRLKYLSAIGSGTRSRFKV